MVLLVYTRTGFKSLRCPAQRVVFTLFSYANWFHVFHSQCLPSIKENYKRRNSQSDAMLATGAHSWVPKLEPEVTVAVSRSREICLPDRKRWTVSRYGGQSRDSWRVQKHIFCSLDTSIKLHRVHIEKQHNRQ